MSPRKKNINSQLPEGTLHEDNYEMLLERIEAFADDTVSQYGGNITDFIEILQDLVDANTEQFFDLTPEEQAAMAKGGPVT